tara:strand:- start:370 stop:1158 length:789 start_codon:yes stop_codon:yes gene_type:complete
MQQTTGDGRVSKKAKSCPVKVVCQLKDVAHSAIRPLMKLGYDEIMEDHHAELKEALLLPDVVRAILTGGTDVLRIIALENLPPATLRDDDVVASVFHLLENTNSHDIRDAVLEAFVYQGDADALIRKHIDSILTMMESCCPFVRSSAISITLGMDQGSLAKYAPIVIRMLDDDDPCVKFNTLNFLAALEPEALAKYVSRVAEMLEDEESGVREMALDVLQELDFDDLQRHEDSIRSLFKRDPEMTCHFPELLERWPALLDDI